MLKIINSSSDQATAERIAADFRQAGYEVSAAPLTGDLVHGDLAILILSQAALVDTTIQERMIQALDLSLHIVPVMTQRVALPRLIDHLDVVDFSDGYDFALLRKQVDLELSPDAPKVMRVLTPTVRRSNRTAGIVVGVAALIMFVVGLYAVAVLHIQAPYQEFNTVDTEVAMTRDIIVAPVLKVYAQFLPQNSEEATNYPATLMAIPTVYRPLMELTATAIVTTPTPNDSGDSDFGF